MTKRTTAFLVNDILIRQAMVTDLETIDAIDNYRLPRSTCNCQTAPEAAPAESHQHTPQ